MSTLRPLIAGTLIAAAGLIGVNGIAYAATGGNLILGHSNHASTVTKVTRTTKGPALALHVKSQQVPFTVNSTKQVAKLNASYLGGMAATSLQTHAVAYNLPVSTTATTSTVYPLAGLPAGTYDASFDVVGRMTTSGSTLECVLETADLTDQLLGYGSTYASFSAVSASALVTVAAGHPLQLRCFTSSGTYALTSTAPPKVDFTKIDTVTTHTVTTDTAAASARPRGTAASTNSRR